MGLLIRVNLGTVNLERGVEELDLLTSILESLVQTLNDEIYSLIGSPFAEFGRLVNQNLAA